MGIETKPIQQQELTELKRTIIRISKISFELSQILTKFLQHYKSTSYNFVVSIEAKGIDGVETYKTK